MQSKTGKPPQTAARRRARQAEQLRANLQRRKAQARERAKAATPEPDTPPPKSETK